MHRWRTAVVFCGAVNPRHLCPFTRIHKCTQSIKTQLSITKHVKILQQQAYHLLQVAGIPIRPAYYPVVKTDAVKLVIFFIQVG